MIERELPINKTIPKEHSDDFKRILALVSKNGMLYLHKNNGLKENREIFMTSVLNTPWIIQHIPEHLKDDEEWVTIQLVLDAVLVKYDELAMRNNISFKSTIICNII